ncbi:MAG: hypothetical protein R3B13_17705 [Polyangiaceae bacterium]
MRYRNALLPLALTLSTGACAHHAKHRVEPGLTLTASAPSPRATLVWVGKGKAELFDEGAWRRVPEFDYEFVVEQQRFDDHWESTKALRRRHPNYDGSAGPRVQVMSFRIDITKATDGERYDVQSTLGTGAGHGDSAHRRAVLQLDADTGPFAPFDRYRITQDYAYDAGRLTELVELNDGDEPWVRNWEEAKLFGDAGPAKASSALAP